MELFLDVLQCVHQKLNSIFGHNSYFFAGYSSFEWSKLNHVTNWASQCIAAKSDYNLRWSLWSVIPVYLRKMLGTRYAPVGTRFSFILGTRL